MKIISIEITVFFALLLLFLNACGRHSKELPAEAAVNGLPLADNPLFANACFGVVNARIDTVTTDHYPAVYAVGDKLLMADVKKDEEFGWPYYRNNPSATGVDRTYLQTDSIEVKCDGFVRATTVLKDVALYSDAKLTTQVCTLAGGQVLKTDIKYIVVLDGNRARSYLLTIYPNDLLGSNCPKSNLYASVPSEATRLSNGGTHYGPYLPIAIVYAMP